MKKQNKYLEAHPRATIEAAIKRAQEKTRQLKIDGWTKSKRIEGRGLELIKDDAELEKLGLLDGCYVIKTDTYSDSKESVHDRYKDLKYVELAFRTCKTTHLELRPIYVRKESRTDGHVFVVMLAYKLIRYLKEAWYRLNITVEEGLKEMGSICGIIFNESDPVVQIVPKPRELGRQLLEAIDVILPEVHIHRKVTVDTRKRLRKSF